MSDPFIITRGDRLPKLAWALDDALNTVGASVVFNAKDSKGNLVIDAQPASFIKHTGEDGIERDALLYEWQDGDTENLTRVSYGTFKITFADDLPETHPNSFHIILSITQNIGTL